MTPRITVTRIDDPDEASSIVEEITERRLRDIRCRAWDYFERRGQMVGNDWEDWLLAERELLWKPRAEMFENASAIVLRVAVPGFHPSDLQITATPRAVLIHAAETHCHNGLESRLHFCEFGQQLFRRFDLPKPVVPKKVFATLDKGILEIVATLARQPRSAPEEPSASLPDETQCRAASVEQSDRYGDPTGSCPTGG